MGLMLNRTATAATIVTFAEAAFVGSVTLVAFTVTVAGDGTLVGATNSPLLKIVPHAAPAQPTPLTVQVTSVFEVPDAIPANCWVLPALIVATFGFIMTVTGVVLIVSIAGLLVTLPFESLTVTVNALPLSETDVAEVV